jgi:hypothetical protein
MEARFILSKKDFRSVMDDSGNACGFLSIRGMLPANHFAKNWTFAEFMDAGQWNPAEKKGKMMDTADDEVQLMQLAFALNVCIKVYAEVAPMVVIESACAVFGCSDAPYTVNIVKELNKSHFVGVVLEDVRSAEDESLALALDLEEQENQRAEQIRRDEELARSLCVLTV